MLTVFRDEKLRDYMHSVIKRYGMEGDQHFFFIFEPKWKWVNV